LTKQIGFDDNTFQGPNMINMILIIEAFQLK